MKKALLLINIGTPKEPTKREVRKYLTRFLNDGNVIDIPWLARKILVNLIIVPFRAGKSARLYQKLWTEKGSPLKYLTENLVAKLQKKLTGEFDVYYAMRYSRPTLQDVLEKLKDNGTEELTLLPMFPQYATSTTLSVKLEVEKQLKKWDKQPKVKFISQFYDHPKFIGAFLAQVKKYDLNTYDHVLFSYHGLPERQLNKLHPTVGCAECACHKSMPAHGANCYKATCYETSRLLAQGLGLTHQDYSVSFQSRLSKKWLTPFTDQKLKDFIRQGKKNILVVAPSFVTDCLETIVEIEYEYQAMFLEEGGEKLDMVPSLNDTGEWALAIESIIKK